MSLSSQFRSRDASYLCSAAIILFSSSPALAADVRRASMPITDCATVKNKKQRLLCVDKAAAALKTTRLLRKLGTAHIKEIFANPGQTASEIHDPDHLDVAPGTFIERLVEIRNVRCLYSTDGYRCIAHRRGMAPVVRPGCRTSGRTRKSENRLRPAR